MQGARDSTGQGVNITGLNLFTLSLERSSGGREEATGGREGAVDGKILELIRGPRLPLQGKWSRVHRTK